VPAPPHGLLSLLALTWLTTLLTAAVWTLTGTGWGLLALALAGTLALVGAEYVVHDVPASRRRG
jgi:hypothetical protein